jgi:hypothetical protein
VFLQLPTIIYIEPLKYFLAALTKPSQSDKLTYASPLKLSQSAIIT